MRLIVAVLVLLCSASALADGIKEGLWHYEATMQFGAGAPAMPDMAKLPPGMQPPAFGPQGMKMDFERCVTRDKFVPTNDKGREKCDIKKMERRGNTVTWAT